jgi:uncharacterized protein (TIGR00369 family)
MSASETSATVPGPWGEPRSRTVTWHDPAITATEGARLSGLEHLQAMIDGVLPPPPIMAVTRATLVEVGDGTARFSCTPDESLYNPIGVVHGGLVCTLLDSAAGCAVQTRLPAGVGYTSLEIKVNYLRAVHADSGPLDVVGTVVRVGRRVAVADAQAHDASGTLVATASSTCLVIPR